MTLKNYHPARRYRAYVSTVGTTQLHLRNPWVVAFWSAMFVGLGHILLSKYLRGFLLFGFEIAIDVVGHINLALFYSFTGQFEMAKGVLDTKLMLLYIPAYFFGIWDSYRTTVDLNNQFLLSVREDAAIKPFKMDAIEINYLDKKAPWSAVFWSLLVPGAGQIAIHRLITAFFILAWTIVVIYQANVLPAIHHTMAGNFEQAKTMLNIHWFLNIPSLYFFAAYDACVNTVESNKVFDWEQAKYLKRKYQRSDYPMPTNKQRGSKAMYIVSTFRYSIGLEKAVTALEMKGVKKQDILAIPMDKRGESPQLFDTMNQSDGLSLLDLSFILGSFFALLGAIYGFNLYWGPVIWGLIGFVVGAAAGLLIKLLLNKKYLEDRSQTTDSEVVLIIDCQANEAETIKKVLWEHDALGVRKLDLSGV